MPKTRSTYVGDEVSSSTHPYSSIDKGAEEYECTPLEVEFHTKGLG